MKRLTLLEFNDRMEAMLRARKLFQSLKDQKCPHCKKEFKAPLNVTKIFQAYQELVAEQDRVVFINTYAMPYMPERATAISGLDQNKRPKCPKCSKPMLFMPHIGQMGPKGNPAGWQTGWSCPDTPLEDKECWYIHYSKKPVSYWMELIKKGPITQLVLEAKDDKVELKRPCDKPCGKRRTA